MAPRNGIDYASLRRSVKPVEELPFSTERKYMATVAETAAGRRYLFVKGAPEIVYGLCRNFAGNVTKEQVDTQLREYQAQAMRTLGFAVQESRPAMPRSPTAR